MPKKLLTIVASLMTAAIVGCGSSGDKSAVPAATPTPLPVANQKTGGLKNVPPPPKNAPGADKLLKTP
ncbi:MAG: hypothetical protein L0241_11460 [Planctomycetia bacterium]|nr:hypothetical protein [Planctomycetia bacterium]